jgi:hypothetical protein
VLVGCGLYWLHHDGEERTRCFVCRWGLVTVAALPLTTESHHLPAYPLRPRKTYQIKGTPSQTPALNSGLSLRDCLHAPPPFLRNVFQMRPIQSWYQLLRCLQLYPIYGQKPEVPPRYGNAEDRPRSASSNPVCMRLGWPGRDSQRTAGLCGE